MRSKSILAERVVVSIGSTAVFFCSTAVFIGDFLLQERNALGIVVSRPQARMAELKPDGNEVAGTPKCF